MKLYLHIGSPKTGTTAIQVLMAEHSGLLVDEGAYVTGVCYANNHLEFAMLAVDFERANQLGAIKRELQLRGISTSEGFEHWRGKFLRRLEKDLSIAAKRGANKYLVSSEFLFFLNPQEIERLRDLMEGLFSQIAVVVFVRDQISQVESWYSTKLKNGFDGTLTSYLDSLLDPQGLMNWMHLDQKWSKVFGPANVLVRAHDPRVDVRENFLLACGIKLAVMPERRLDETNSALSKLEAMLLQLARKKFGIAGGYLTDMREKRNLLTLAIIGKFPGDRMRLTSEQCNEIQKTFSASNTELMKARGVDLKLNVSKPLLASGNLDLNEDQLNAILELLEAKHLTRMRLMQARLGTLTYVALVRLGLRPLARSFKRLVKTLLRRRGTPLPMY
jgi:hypothetical protein